MRGGVTWDPDDKERTALHEAGHAVVAWSFDLPLGSIYLDLEKESGGTTADRASIARLTLVEQIANWLAGYEAEQAFKRPGRKWNAGDDGQVRRILRENDTPEDTPEGQDLGEQGRACAEARLLKHEAKVRCVARHLIEHHYIDRVTFEEMMQRRKLGQIVRSLAAQLRAHLPTARRSSSSGRCQ